MAVSLSPASVVAAEVKLDREVTKYAGNAKGARRLVRRRGRAAVRRMVFDEVR